MIFNSLSFLIFFPVVVLLYWLLPHRWRNPMLLAASYYFYMNWEPVYALLIFLSTLTTWGAGRLIECWDARRRGIMIACVCINLGILFTFKYLRFIADQLQVGMDSLGIGMQVPSFELLLPVGISFYTFQALGYIIDVYRREIHAERSLMTYALFVAFFPQLVAGPIERAKSLLPQFHEKHSLHNEMLLTGLRLMMWGYFMKVCVADNLSPYVDAVYNNIEIHNGKSIWLATIFFTFQIFCDFAGYSLIAIGTARAIGFSLMQNFRQPYLAPSVKEFWRRWHISLSTWFSDYVYKPLGGSRCSRFRHARNLMTTFLVSGIWHGANWTFLVWGGYHGTLQVAYAQKRHIPVLNRQSSRLTNILSIILTFILVAIGWVIFRANTIGDAWIALKKMAKPSGMLFEGDGKPALAMGIFLIVILIVHEILLERRNRKSDTPVQLVSPSLTVASMLSVVALFVMILLCGQFDGGQFIYFQF